MKKTYLTKNGLVVYTDNPEKFLEDGWKNQSKKLEAKKPVRKKHGKKNKATK